MGEEGCFGKAVVVQRPRERGTLGFDGEGQRSSICSLFLASLRWSYGYGIEMPIT